MPRSLVLGNGNLLTTFDSDMLMRDIYFPYVGEEDHTTYQHKHRIGVLVEGKGFSWLDDGSWKIDPRYATDTLIGQSMMTNDNLGISMEAADFVHPVKDILVRHFRVKTNTKEIRTVKFYFHHDIHPYGDKQKDTAFYEPGTNSVIHYRKQRYFLVGGSASDKGLTSFTTGKSEYRELEGTWKDAEDGILSQHPIEQGSVDSTIELTAVVEPDKETDVYMWLCAGTALHEVLDLHEFINEEGVEQMEDSTRNYWESWVHKTNQEYGSLDPELVELYKRSLLIVRTQADNRGGIIAANDSDIMQFNRDTYTYVWPRDGAFICMAMDKAGYQEMTRRFFHFCCEVQSQEGYLLHKYNPDGSPGSSWHPWFRDGEFQLPIQEDETALVILAMWQHFERFHDFEWLQEMYEEFVKEAADFLVEYREEKTNLPLATYDPWEEHRGIFSYTAATTYAGLIAAAKISQALGHVKHANEYQKAGDEVGEAILLHLYDEDSGRFVKKIKRKGGKLVEKDLTPDASVALLWKFGLLPPEDKRMISTMKQLEEMLRVKTPVGGYARYPNDFYHFYDMEHSDQIPGNPWIITTLWFAQWEIENAKKPKDLEKPLETLRWVKEKATPAGILPEQLHPWGDHHLSVSPLTWSHAVYVETMLMWVEKEKELKKK
ncbi:glycoside hydrolase family 15 protein [Candidatus Peribacteria bacterium]|nr:glycoside hydrolase family 15 protein [Candidatus Peribacteria bacterium]MBT4474657.1 glycoside hydrolase family 15 protein [Candidatus Peribacteria bacterium]